MPDSTEAVRPIRSLLRGLDALAAVRGPDGRTVTEVSRATRLPRTTAYRVLETLRLGGYVERELDDRYRATDKGLGLMAAEGNGHANGHGQSANGRGVDAA